MDKKDLFDALDDFSQTLLVTLAEVEAVKKNLKSVVEENIALHLENDKLRVLNSSLAVRSMVTSWLTPMAVTAAADSGLPRSLSRPLM